MNQDRYRRRRRDALCVAGLVLFGASSVAPAGEKIIFSGRTDSRPVVDLNRREPLMDRGLHTPRLPGDSPSDSLTISVASPTPKARLTRRQQEELEERRDWMFRNPNAQSAKESVRTSRAEDEKEPDPRRKTAIERFVEGPTPKGDDSQAEPGNSGESRTRRENPARASLRPDGSKDGAPHSVPSARDFLGDGSRNPAREAAVAGPADLRGFEFTGRVPLDTARRMQARDADSAAFQRALGGALASEFGPASGLSSGATVPGRDLLAPPGSATRPYLLAPGAVVPGSTKNNGFDGTRFGTASTFDTRQAPGATGSVLPPIEPPKKFEQRPTVLEIPKRKF